MLSEFRDWLKKFLFIYATSPKPDGRPLYAYRCRDKDYEALRELIRRALRQLKNSSPGRLYTIFLKISGLSFCHCLSA